MGRFISRDPLGYVDGMSLYNGYFAEEFWLDPYGKETQEEKKKRKEEARKKREEKKKRKEEAEKRKKEEERKKNERPHGEWCEKCKKAKKDDYRKNCKKCEVNKERTGCEVTHCDDGTKCNFSLVPLMRGRTRTFKGTHIKSKQGKFMYTPRCDCGYPYAKVTKVPDDGRVTTAEEDQKRYDHPHIPHEYE